MFEQGKYYCLEGFENCKTFFLCIKPLSYGQLIKLKEFKEIKREGIPSMWRVFHDVLVPLDYLEEVKESKYWLEDDDFI